MQLFRKKRYASLRAYIQFIATFKGRFFAVFGLFMLADIALAIVPIFIGQFVTIVSTHPLNQSQLSAVVAILIAISVSHDMLWRLGEWCYRWLVIRKVYEFETIIFQAVMSRRYPYFVDKFTGKISNYVTALGREFREFIETVFWQYADLVTKLPIIAVIMFSVNIWTGVVFVASIAVMFVAGRALVHQTVMSERALTDVNASMDGYIIDVISNFVSVKAFRHERSEFVAIRKKRSEVVQKARTSMLWGIFFWAAMSLMVRWVIWPGTILLNVYLFLHGQVTLQQITTFISALLIFSDYIWMVVWNVSQFNVKMGQTEEAYQYLFGDEEAVVERYIAGDYDGDVPVSPAFRRNLSLHNLNFAYPDRPDQLILDNISLDIRKDEKVGVVGASGSGKTTLIKLLLGYYDLPEDMVTLDGEPIENRHLVDLIAYVPQDTPLFHRSIRENIAYGADGAVTDEDIKLAAQRAHAHEFIELTTDGYDTLVGERGIKLSMGQRQRVAIARAFLDDKPILVLDEATSALDSESEVLVQQALEELWHNRTVIAIAHRLSTLRHMDRIIVMDKGRIIEQGSHRQLLAMKGKYYRLWQHQSGGVLQAEAEN